ncbi:hypothetical protein DICPUDRAFT_80605 [Dictyostelium purpureum]|uniref:RNA helicase n=1 Tax=Dictyostelium purpureum TaxID=5786 RepID=F0ZQZ6_DICPU|nr:uncharacterized protein DICPUDRAFT_80605 [Dictyostelium purpureum]EGC33619.1 hypothetical protein DICPUDRAFT_80605 [Dictyostelium purpureum]|eukprot:XP_003289839.1 hypothetical protein DICPUDRAFT_80605 [Dictyostelium purpureum]
MVQPDLTPKKSIINNNNNNNNNKNVVNKTKFKPNTDKAVRRITPNLVSPNVSNNKLSTTTSNTTKTTTVNNDTDNRLKISKEIMDQKEALPVFTAKDALLKNFRVHDTVIIISETGTGKTTQFEGKCYRLYTQDTFEKFDESSIPEMKRSNIANVILQLKTIGIQDILGFDFLERPPLVTVKKSLELLYCLDALKDDGTLSELGKKMALFPLDPMYSKALIKSAEFDCLEEVLIIISMLSVESIFFTPKDKKKEVEDVKKIFFSPEGDHITFLNVFREYQKVNGNNQWCFDHFINTKSMAKVVNVFEQLVKYCISLKMKIVSCDQDLDRVKKSFIGGFFMNVAVLQPDKKYKTMVDNKEIQIHPTSFLFGQIPQHILYNELTITTKAFARNVMPIEASWLPEICPKYYGTKQVISNDPNSTSIEETTNAFK